jgi:hypothetical protein
MRREERGLFGSEEKALGDFHVSLVLLYGGRI